MYYIKFLYKYFDIWDWFHKLETNRECWKPFKSRLKQKISEMKTKLLTLALFGILTLGVLSCSNEEVVPSNEIQLNETHTTSSSTGGIKTRNY